MKYEDKTIETELKVIGQKLDQVIAMNNENRILLIQLLNGVKTEPKNGAVPEKAAEGGKDTVARLEKDAVRLNAEIEAGMKLDRAYEADLAKTGDVTESNKLNVLLRNNREKLKDLQMQYDYTIREIALLKERIESESIESLRAEVENVKEAAHSLTNSMEVKRRARFKETDPEHCKILEEELALMEKELQEINKKHCNLIAKQQERLRQ